jgi:RNA polymerase sigma factor (TIGR02999 family)
VSAPQSFDSLTGLLNAARAGDAAAGSSAYALVYAELKRGARRALRAARPGDTLTPTALVHELYLRFGSSDGRPLRDRGHFFALAARAMRQILIDQARRRGSRKRGGDGIRTDFDTALGLAAHELDRAVEIDAALRALEARDAELAQLVEWHFFGGLNFAEIAHETGRHERTVRRDWELARAFLQRALDCAT